jgi:mono/diheme cytochrome c family protein
MKKIWIVLVFFLSACSMMDSGSLSPMMDSGMQARHHMTVPQPYAGMTSPAMDDQRLADGEQTYASMCASCHGNTGAGDGAAGASLTPPAAPIAHTSQMLGDDYLFWRISAGGLDLQTSMPPWKGVLTDDQIWNVIAYTRALGKANADEMRMIQSAQIDAVLKKALNQKLITDAEAESFRTVHAALESYLIANTPSGSMTEKESAALSALVADGTLTQDQAQEFQRIHAILIQNGMMQ